MKFANIREMHQLSAVGVAKEAAVDDKGLYLGAKIVDDQAWQKITEGVYKGYSIGGRVTNRDPADHNHQKNQPAADEEPRRYRTGALL